MRGRVTLCVVLAGLSCAPPTFAEPGHDQTQVEAPLAPSAAASAAQIIDQAETLAEPRRLARERFDDGVRLFEEGEYELSLTQFERAFELTSDYRVLYNIGQVRIILRRHADAVRALTLYLEQGGDAVGAERRQAVLGDLEMLTARTARLVVTANVPDVELLIDDVRLAPPALDTPLLVDAGERRITVKKPGYLPETQRIMLAGRDSRTVSFFLDLLPEPSAAEPPAQASRPSAPPGASARAPNHGDPEKAWLTAGWISTGTLALGAVGAGLIGYMAYQDREQELGRRTSSGELDRLEARSERWFLVGDLCALGALLTGGTTLYFSWIHPGSDAPSRSP